MTKAYDTTWQRGILNVIYDMGLRGFVAFFIANFLRDSTFRTRIGQQYSSEHLQEDGVPQGSILSCTLFSLAINHIANNLPRDVSSSLYIDDQMIYSSSSHPPALERLQLAINAVSSWSISHSFTIAHTDNKTVAIHFNRKRGHAEPSLFLENRMINFKPNSKFLGITLDQKLNCKAHIQKLKSDCMKRRGILRCISNTYWGADRVTMLRLYRALIRSKLDYGCMIYSSANPYILNTLDSVHNEGIRICTGAFKSSPISSLYAETGEPSLSTRRAKLTIQFFTHIHLLPDSPAFKSIHRTPLEVAPPGSFAIKTYENFRLINMSPPCVIQT